MKKIIIILIVVLFLFSISKNDDMLRIRVLANSNSDYDQKIKSDVVDIVKHEFNTILKGITNIEEARTKINDNLDNISNKIDNYLEENKINYNSTINFGLNYFPTKEYNGKKYSEGYYESVLVKLGSGEGENWWCILFPSVCLTDKDSKYESLIKNIFEKLFK